MYQLTIKLESHDYKTSTVAPALRKPGDRIRAMAIQTRHSKASGKAFFAIKLYGISNEGRSVWVTGGLRATFVLDVEPALDDEHDRDEQVAFCENSPIIARALTSEKAHKANEELKAKHERMVATFWEAATKPGTFKTDMEPVVNDLMDHASVELQRLERLMKKILETYRGLCERFRALEKIGTGEVASCEQAIPAFIFEGAFPWGKEARKEDEMLFNFLFAQAERVNGRFQSTVEELVATFNRATKPEELGLDPEVHCLTIQNGHAESNGLPNCEFCAGPLKKKARGRFKVHNDYKGAEHPSAKLVDVVRAQLKFRDPYAIRVFYDVLKERKLCKSLRVRRCKNKFSPSFDAEFEYRDVLVNVEFEGHICELQLALHDMSEVKKQMHKFYKVNRVRETGAYAELLGLFGSAPCDDVDELSLSAEHA